jgi:hypothetical protein
VLPRRYVESFCLYLLFTLDFILVVPAFPVSSLSPTRLLVSASASLFGLS